MQKMDSFWILFSSFSLSSLAGLAALLRGGAKLTPLNVTTSVLNSGLLGLGIALLWHNAFQGDPLFLVGVCTLAGLGGMTMIDFILTCFRKGGLTLTVGKGGENDKSN